MAGSPLGGPITVIRQPTTAPQIKQENGNCWFVDSSSSCSVCLLRFDYCFYSVIYLSSFRENKNFKNMDHYSFCQISNIW